MILPTHKVWRATFKASLLLTALSLVISAGARLLMGLGYDSTLFAIRALASLSIVMPLSLLVFSRLERWENAYVELLRQAQKLAQEASTDPLTGLLNRRSFESQFNAAMSTRKGGSFIVADVDYLKSINDLHGHLAGDDAILAAATALYQVLGPEALLARIGGDEFCAFLPRGPATLAEQISDQINALATEDFARRSGLPQGKLSVSIGVQPCRGREDFRSMMRNTDNDLYRKKHRRNGTGPQNFAA